MCATDANRKQRGRFRLRLGVLGLGWLAAFGLLAVHSPLQAQTVRGYATLTISSPSDYSPQDVAVDGNGNVFVTYTGEAAVYEIVAANGVVSPNSQVIPLGGNTFSRPFGLAADSSGDVFVADLNNNAVYKILAVNGAVPSNPTINTLASGLQQPSGVAVDGSGNVFVAGGRNNVYEIPGGTGSPVLVSSAFAALVAVAVDRSGNVFVADEYNSAVYEIVAVNGAVSASSQVIAVGTGFNDPWGVAVDGSGNVFVADTENAAVKEILAVNGSVNAGSQVIPLGGGFNYPEGVAVDGSGNVFVAGVGLPGAVYEIVAGAEKFSATPVGSTSAPSTISFAFDSAATLDQTPYRVVTQGAPNLDFQAAPTQPANACVAGQSYNAGDICAVNVIFTPAKPYQRIGAVQLTGSSGAPIATFNLSGTGTGPQVIFPGNLTANPVGSGIPDPYGVAVDSSGDVFVADTYKGAVYKIVAANGLVNASSTVNTLASGFSALRSVAVDGSGNVFVADAGGAVYEIAAGTNSAVPVGSGFEGPTGVAVDGSGNVFVAEHGSGGAVKEIVAVNGAVGASSQVNTLASGFSFPRSIAVDGSGNVFVAEQGNGGAVKEIVAVNGAVSASSQVIAVGGGFNSPTGVAVDGSGNVFVTDAETNAVYEILAVNGAVPSSPTILTVATGFDGPESIAVDSSGNLFIADSQNAAVKEIDRSDPPSLAFASTAVGSTSSDSPQSVSVESIGNAPLSLIGIGAPSSTSFKQVSGSGTPPDCAASTSLAPGESCNLSFSFTPAVSGPLQSTEVLSDNALNGNPATQTINLSGTGIALNQTITFNPIPNQVQGTTLTLTATASSGLAVSYTSSTPSVCTVSVSTATLVSPGMCTIVASQGGNNVYAAATSVSQSFTVLPSANFTITPMPASETVYRGVLAAFLLKLQSVNGFSGYVALSCSGGPAGSKCADLPQTVHLKGTAEAISGILFPKTTPPGTYTMKFTGASGSLTNSATAKFTVK